MSNYTLHLKCQVIKKFCKKVANTKNVCYISSVKDRGECMTKINCDLLNETIKLMKEQYKEYLKLNKKDFEYEEELLEKLCDCLEDTISELEYELQETKIQLGRNEYDKYLDHLGDIADERYEKNKLGL